MMNNETMIIFIMEGKSDVKFILGLIGIGKLKRCNKIMHYECYNAINDNACVCDGHGKDNVCSMVEELIADYENRIKEIHVILDGDAVDVKCSKAAMHYLKHRNLDDLVFELIQRMLNRCCNDELMLRLLDVEGSNIDSKKKVYLAMYLTWKFRDRLGLSDVNYWSDVSSFYYYLGLMFSGKINQVIELDGELANILNILSGGHLGGDT